MYSTFGKLAKNLRKNLVDKIVRFKNIHQMDKIHLNNGRILFPGINSMNSSMHVGLLDG